MSVLAREQETDISPLWIVHQGKSRTPRTSTTGTLARVVVGTGVRYSGAVVMRHDKTATRISLFELVEEHRLLFLLSPLWLTAILLLLDLVSGRQVHDVLQFMAPWSWGPISR